MLTLEFARGGSAPDFSTGRQVDLWRDERGEVCARLFAGPSLKWIDWPGLGVFWFAPGDTSVRVQPADRVDPDLLGETFARMLQPAILQAMGWQALHASAVVGPAGLLAFSGSAQAGKSTIAFALDRAGFRHFADDALVIDVAAVEVQAHALPFAPRLRPSAREHFGAAARPIVRAGGERAPIAAFFLLTQDTALAGPPRRTRVPAARAFSQLMTHAHCFDPDDPIESRRLVEDYLSIVARVPVYELTYRPAFDRLPELVESITDEYTSHPGPVGAGR